MQSRQHFTMEERIRLQELLQAGKKKAEIARELGKNRSSITRELQRNGKKDGGYNHWWATCMYIHRRKKCRTPHRIEKAPELQEFINNSLKKYHSPELITVMWKRKHHGQKLSPSTIYRAVRRGLFEKITPKTHFRRRGKRINCRNTATIKAEHTIHERPEAANTRSRIGDWEGDLLLGKNQLSALVTLIDRKSRMLASKRIIGKTAEVVEEAIVALLDKLTVRSITLDRGAEFANFKSFEAKLKTTVYFADPNSPWQRASNENINGLLRFFFPKGTDFSTVSDSELNNVLAIINDRPRKCLDWLAPADLFFSCCF